MQIDSTLDSFFMLDLYATHVQLTKNYRAGSTRSSPAVRAVCGSLVRPRGTERGLSSNLKRAGHERRFLRRAPFAVEKARLAAVGARKGLGRVWTEVGPGQRRKALGEWLRGA